MATLKTRFDSDPMEYVSSYLLDTYKRLYLQKYGTLSGAFAPGFVEDSASVGASARTLEDVEPEVAREEFAASSEIRTDVVFKDESLHQQAIAEARRKFKIYPSAYANGYMVRRYKELYKQKHGSLGGAFEGRADAKSSRSPAQRGLIKKRITNKEGEMQTVWVRGERSPKSTNYSRELSKSVVAIWGDEAGKSTAKRVINILSHIHGLPGEGSLVRQARYGMDEEHFDAHSRVALYIHDGTQRLAQGDGLAGNYVYDRKGSSEGVEYNHEIQIKGNKYIHSTLIHEMGHFIDHIATPVTPHSSDSSVRGMYVFGSQFSFYTREYLERTKSLPESESNDSRVREALLDSYEYTEFYSYRRVPTDEGDEIERAVAKSSNASSKLLLLTNNLMHHLNTGEVAGYWSRELESGDDERRKLAAYYLHPTELFARGYEQYVYSECKSNPALKNSKDAQRIVSEFEDSRLQSYAFGNPRYPSDEYFAEKIKPAFDEFFEDLGMRNNRR